MTVQELITRLSQLPPDTRVVVEGYETGYNDILEFKGLMLKLDVSTDWWDGQHDEKKDGDEVAVALVGRNLKARDDKDYIPR